MYRLPNGGLETSTPSPASWVALDHDLSAKGPRSQSPALSTTSTADEDHGASSPVIPALPTPQLTERALKLLRTPPPTHRSESVAGHSVNAASTQFYTASWGSPYETAYQSSSIGGVAPTALNDQNSAGSDSSERSDSPIRHLDFHTPFLRPPPAFPRSRSTEPAGGLANVLAKRARRPAHGLTEDWIRAHTGGEFREGASWLSDVEAESEHSSLSGSVSADSKQWPDKDSGPQTPTLKSYVHQKERDRAGQFLLPGLHHRHTSIETLKQEDFASGSSESIATDMANMGNPALNLEEGRPPLPARLSQNMDKQLPPPPTPEKDSERRSAGNLAAQSHPMMPQLSTSPAPPHVRLKKKLPWKGTKTLTILIPMDDERGQRGKAPKPMTKADVANMNRDWQQLGYDITGFNLGYGRNSTDGSASGRSREVWPNPDDSREEHLSRQFKVSIPDRSKWDAYVKELAEAKLRALGVSLPGEDPPPASISPALPSRKSSISITRHTSMSVSRRNSTMQYPALPFSPPLPTGSATSSHMTHPNQPFSPNFTAGPGLSTTSLSSNVGSIASPASMQAQFQNKYNPRQSVSFGSNGGTNEHPFGSPFQFPNQASPGFFSPSQTTFGHQGMPRGGSPAFPNQNSFLSPSSPLSADGYYAPESSIPLRHQVLEAGARRSPRLQDLREVEDLDEVDLKSPSRTPEASVLNRGHNPSASLQKEIEDAEYHLEEQIQRELDHEDYSPHQSETGKTDTVLKDMSNTNINTSSMGSLKTGISNSRYATESDKDGPMLHHPQPHSRGHSLSQRPYNDTDDDMPNLNGVNNKLGHGTVIPSQIQTNPPFGHQKTTSFTSNVSNPWSQSHSRSASLASVNRPKHSGHSSKASISGLNVEAKEFKFDASASFQPSQFSFSQSNNFHPIPTFQAPSQSSSFQPPPKSAFAFEAPIRPQHAHNQSSFGSSKAFASKINPDAPVFSPSSSTFNFSAAGPTFRPGAPTFSPTTGGPSAFGSSTNGSNSIFGNLNMAEVIRQPKKSKAVPIIRPDSPKEDEESFDAAGRLTRGAGREKRARGEKGDGDSIPLFATPSEPLSETTREQSPPKEHVAAIVTAENKENATPSSDQDETSEERIPGPAHQRQKSILDDMPDYDGSGWASWGESFHERKDAEDMNASKPLAIPKRMASFELYDPGSSDDRELSQSFIAEAVKGHKKNASGLSANAKPFDFRTAASARPDNSPFTFGASLAKHEEPEESPEPSTPPAPVKKPVRGLRDSIYAASPTPEPEERFGQRFGENEDEDVTEHDDDDDLPDPILDVSDDQFPMDELEIPQQSTEFSEHDDEGVEDEDEASTHRELSYEEIDERMRLLNEIEKKASPAPKTSSRLELPRLNVLDVPLSPLRFNHPHMRSDAPSPSPRRDRDLPVRDLSHQFGIPATTVEETPSKKQFGQGSSSPIHRLNTSNSMAQSDWNDMLEDGEKAKLETRTQFFDTRVNDVVGEVLSDRLAPMERVLESVSRSVELLTAREKMPLSRRERRSFSGDFPQSDADDEDEEHIARRSMSPSVRKYDKIRTIIAEALAAHRPVTSSSQDPATANPDNSSVLKALEEMRDQFGQSMRLDLRGEDLRNIVEEAVDKRMPALFDEEKPHPKVAELEAKVAELTEKPNTRITELETKVAELTARLQSSESNVEVEIKNRRAAEDRMAEIQRLLRISSEEEVRLRESLDDHEQKMKIAEDAIANLTRKNSGMEASQEINQQIQADALHRVHALESELLEARRIASSWQLDTERALEAARRHNEDAESANETNSKLRMRMEKLRAQLEESTRIKEGIRGKFNSLQEDMAQAAHQISEENATRAKREQELIARQEVLDAKLQAEARTRERLETEIERLESGERDAMRAVSENRRLDSLLGELRSENHEAQKLAMRYKREFEEARESGLSEVQRTRSYMQNEIDSANHEVNVVRDEMEHQIARLRTELDQVRLDADTYRARNDMFLEEATEAKRNITDELTRRHERIVEDLQTRHESKLNDTIEDAHRAEQHLLERLSLSSAKTEHLQDRVSHLEEKLEIAQAAANAAAQAARTASLASPVATSAPAPSKPAETSQLPEKISPQALRESIMVLQEQLQDREQKIEKLEQSLSTADPDAPNKISKRDDEITWLRELLGVRNADLQDIVNALSTDNYDAEAVRDAAIRLRANLQMEEQERERAMNGASAVNLPNIAASLGNLRDVASPRIAQGVGSLAAAWGNWRKTNDTPSSKAAASVNRNNARDNGTPSRSSLLSGLLTPPASTRTPLNRTKSSSTQSSEMQPQPTAFNSTGRRLMAGANRPGSSLSSANRPGSSLSASSRNQNSLTPRAKEKMPMRGVPGTVPATPPMMRQGSYDDDADARATDDGFGFSEDEGGDLGTFYDDVDSGEGGFAQL